MTKRFVCLFTKHNYFHWDMPWPSTGPIRFWFCTCPNCQNAKFNSEKLFLVWSKQFGRIQNRFGPIEGQDISTYLDLWPISKVLYPSFGNLTTHITIMTGGSGLVDKGRILSIGGSSMFNVWEKDSQCDQLSGTRQGPL